MGNSQGSVQKRIQHAQRSGVCQLSNQGLDQIPPQLWKLTNNLRTMDLSKNKLDSLPEDIAKFTALKSIILSNNSLSVLCDSICKLKKLESLAVAYNRLSSLPPDIGKLSSLKKISLQGNKLSYIPPGLTQLRQLDVLDLSQNSIDTIPNEIQGLQAVELNLNQNQISFLPESLSKCPRLKVLRFEENCVPLEGMSEKILTDSKVSLLAFDGNLFDQKSFQGLNGYDTYMKRYTATKKKFD